ncbi:hypothetical protein ACPW65_003328 [Enterobacter roggenkampii]
MAINNFKPFALDPNANVTSQADWEALPALLSGFTAGKASSAQVNKAIRQASFIAAALAQYTANKSGLDVLDDGDLNGFISKMGTAFGKDFQALDATLSALAGLATGANKLPYFTGNDTAAQTDLTSVGRDIIGKNTIADILTYLGLGTGLTGIIGQSRNATISIIAPSASSTFKADELIVQTALGGTQYKLTNVNVTGSLSAVSAGGVDVAGTVPTTGYMAKYVIYNPQSGAEALLYQNATSAKVSEVYSGTAMPAGYTASALVSIWPVNGLQFAVGNQKGRKVSIPVSTIIATTSSTTSGNSTVGTFTNNFIPLNAILIDGNCIILANGGQQAEVSLLSVPVPGTGLRFAINAIASSVSSGNAQCFSNYPIYTPQSVLVYAFSTNGTTFNYTITINGYTF